MNVCLTFYIFYVNMNIDKGDMYGKINRQTKKDILDVIKQAIAKNGYPPTVREIGAKIGLSSSATTQFHIKKLEEKGYIKKNATKNRTIELLVPNEYIENDEKIVSVPLLGKVTAGNPIEAIEMPDEFFSIPVSLIPSKKKKYLRLKLVVNL